MLAIDNDTPHDSTVQLLFNTNIIRGKISGVNGTELASMEIKGTV